MSTLTGGEKLYLVDGTSQLFRAYYALSGLTNATGMATNAIYGFTTMLRKLLREDRPSHLAVAFDVRGPVFRHKQYASYKANRPPTPEDLTQQMPYARQVCEVLGIPVLALEGYEADDLIATFATRAAAASLPVVVVASDKDLLQLVSDEISVFNPSKNVLMDASVVSESFGVPPERVGDVLGLMGDSVDNVPGVPGVGKKSALSMVTTYGGVESIIARAALFVELYDARDALLLEIESLKSCASMDAGRVESLGRQVSRVAAAAGSLADAERDPEFRPRLADLVGPIDEARSVVEQAEPMEGKKLMRSLAPLKRELKALDRGSQKRAWYSIHEHREQARLSKQLVTLHCEVPVDLELDSLVYQGGDPVASRALFASLGFTTLIDDDDIGGEAAEATPTPDFESMLVNDAAKLEHLAKACLDAESVALEPIAAIREQGSILLGIALAWSGGAAAYLPLAHEYLGVPTQLSIEDARGVLESILSSGHCVSHETKRCNHLLAASGLPWGSWALDTELAAFLLDAGRSHYRFEGLAMEMASRDLKPLEKDGSGMPIEQAATEFGSRASAMWQLAQCLGQRLRSEELEQLYREIDGPLIAVLTRMEARGVRVDVERLASMSSEISTRIEQLRAEVLAHAGHEFNLDSPKQLRVVLFEELQLTRGRKTAKGKESSTDAQTLEELTGEHPIAAALLEYRELTKLKGTYVDALPRLVRPETGRIHSTFHSTGAATGRLSSSDPNLQNIPVRRETGRKIREAFVPDPGFVFLASDYSQVELRILAHLAEDPGLIAAFRAGEDIHRHTAARILGSHPDLVTADMRRRAKAVNFGILYGMSEMRLAREQGIPRAEARRFINSYFERFGRVQEYIDGVREQVQLDGVVHTLFGRRRSFPQLKQRINRAVREQALRAAVNTTIQGTAADLMKMAMLTVDRALGEGGFKARMLLQVHDELLLEVPEAEIEAVAQLVRREMEAVHKLQVPLLVDQKQGGNWREAT